MKFTTVSPQIRLAFEAKMEESLNICRQKSGKDIPTIPIKFSQMGERAGVCHNVWTRTGYGKSGFTLKPNSSFIVINPDYLVKHWDDMLNTTCPHEVAHYVAVFLYGIQANNHKHLWKMVMSWLGISAADRCHQYNTEGVKLRNTHRDFKYSCPCQQVFMLTPKKHQRHQSLISSGLKGLFCRRCKQTIVFQGFQHGEMFIPAAKKMTPVHVEVQPTVFVHTVNPPAPVVPPVVPPVVSGPTYRTVTKFVNGCLVNERVPVCA